MPIVHAFEKLSDSVSVPAGADLDAAQYFLMKYDGSGDAVVADTLGEQTIGVLQNDPPIEEAAVIGTGGYSRVIASAAIALGAHVTTAASGKAVTAAGASSHYVRGIAIIAAAADLDIITIRLVDFIEP